MTTPPPSTPDMPDIWVPVFEWENLYELTSSGKVRNMKTKRQMTGFVDQKGYRCVLLSNNGKVKARKIHKLVMETFLPRPPNTVINHIDGDKNNNCLGNLEYVTQRENVAHGASCKRSLGVTFFAPSKKWQSRITYKGKRIFLGYFETEQEAADAYKNALLNLGLENKYA